MLYLRIFLHNSGYLWQIILWIVSLTQHTRPVLGRFFGDIVLFGGGEGGRRRKNRTTTKQPTFSGCCFVVVPTCVCYCVLGLEKCWKKPWPCYVAEKSRAVDNRSDLKRVEIKNLYRIRIHSLLWTLCNLSLITIPLKLGACAIQTPLLIKKRNEVDTLSPD